MNAPPLPANSTTPEPLSVPPDMLQPAAFIECLVVDNSTQNNLITQISHKGLSAEKIIVRATQKDYYEILSGFSYYWAHVKALPLSNVPVTRYNYSDGEAVKVAVALNGLSLIEQGKTYKKALKQFKWTVNHLTKEIGEKHPYAKRRIDLLNLPDSVQRYLHSGQLDLGHGTHLLDKRLATEERTKLARLAVKEGWSTRRLEKEIKAILQTGLRKPTNLQTSTKSEETLKFEGSLQDALVTSEGVIALNQREDGSSESLGVRYSSLDQLKAIVDQIAARPLYESSLWKGNVAVTVGLEFNNLDELQKILTVIDEFNNAPVKPQPWEGVIARIDNEDHLHEIASSVLCEEREEEY